MNTVTITKKEYKKLVGAKRRVARMEKREGKKTFNDAAFGMWKNTFGETSSVRYVNRLRNSWR